MAKEGTEQKSVGGEPEKEETGTGCLQLCRNISWRERGLILYFGFVDFFGFACVSIMAPFFPAAARRKGVSDTVTGQIFGVFSLVAFAFGPLIGKFLPRIGLRRAIVAGTSLLGVTCLLFGFVDLIEDWMWFVTVCYLLRILQGVGYAFFATTIFALVAHFFPKSMGTVLAILEMFIGIGLSIGPPIGSIFFNLGGFKLPFIVLGMTQMIASLLAFPALPSSSLRDFQSVDLPRMKPFFFHMGSWVVCVAIIVLSSAFAFFYPVLQPHVEAVFGMTESTTALLYLVFTGSYGVTGILSGYIADHFAKWRKAQLGIAFLAIAFSFLLLGPASFLHIPRSLGLLIGSLVLTGASLSFSLIPTFGIINEEARLAGYDDNIGTASLMSGMWNSMFSLGEAVGPAISGALYDVSDFSTAAIVFAGICFGTALMVFLDFYWNLLRGKRRSEELEECREVTTHHISSGTSP